MAGCFQRATTSTGAKTVLGNDSPKRATEELLTYKNGVLHGPAQAANHRGMPVSDGTYYEGKQDGTWTFYLDDGTLQEISVFEDGERTENIRVNGPFTDWHSPDRPAKEVHFCWTGSRTGRFGSGTTKGNTSLKNTSTLRWVEPFGDKS